VNMGGRKMSKSLGNVVTVRDALERYSAEELRFFLLSTHYRKDMDLRGLDASAKRLKDLRRIARSMAGTSEAGEPVGLTFEAAMNDDFDTPRAIGSIERALRVAARARDSGRKAEAALSAASAMEILGVDLLGDS
jgi:cysteinyl-tRNA synthetase